jgi:hypothetical protein
MPPAAESCVHDSVLTAIAQPVPPIASCANGSGSPNHVGR